ncbi:MULTISPECIES: serine protease [unclassified Streptomyces]|uniref:trypsin-like serine peptidase n=1 Tax=unclassified Streptomyces TaxID=2593676 RepID=UPI002256F6EF|nr:MULTISPECIES: trypsin-like serine protease [unclassified Streptomyces]MCX4528785.1 S1 family peptidase [Streptomyces sp. NBC_01551]MCX4540607.1 S1 family peptidase [Streptomyces sp. NBC_01565]
MFTKDHRRAPRVFGLVGVCCALLLGSVGCAWQLSGFAGHLADGDPGQGSYAQDPELGDGAAADLLDGVVREVPPPVGTPSGESGAENAESGPWRVSEPLEARPTAPEPSIGALFSPGDWDSDHHCSASVVHSPGGNLIATAAHCVYQGGFRTNLAFVPGYHDGEAPYGIWVPERIDVDPRWAEDFDPDHDVAFLRLRRPGRPGQRLEDVTGAQTIGFGPELPLPARVVGYPNDAEEPLDCRNTARAAGPAQLRLDCADVPDGTSGGPVLTGAHTLIGVVGGRDGGGDELVSYSSYFGDGVRALYERATGG